MDQSVNVQRSAIEIRQRSIVTRLKNLRRAIADSREQLETNKRFFTASSFYVLKSRERWASKVDRLVEVALNNEERVEVQRFLERQLKVEKMVMAQLAEFPTETEVTDEVLCNS